MQINGNSTDTDYIKLLPQKFLIVQYRQVFWLFHLLIYLPIRRGGQWQRDIKSLPTGCGITAVGTAPDFHRIPS